MMTFFLLAALLLCGTFYSIHFIWKNRKKANLTSNNADWQVMLAKRNEIENDVLLPSHIQTTLREEWLHMADNVLSRYPEPNSASSLSESDVKKNNTWTILIPSAICAVLIYSMIGNWSVEALTHHSALHSSDQTSALATDLPPTHPGNAKNMGDLISQLEKKLKESPNDLNGWVLLARSLGIKRDFAGASAALENALTLSPGHPDILVDLADMLAMTNNKSLAGRPTQLIQEALNNAPNHPKALSLAATAAMQDHDLRLAEKYWKQLRDTFPPDAPDVTEINTILANLRNEAGVAEPVQDNATSIEGQVMLSPALLAQINKAGLPENATLFVVAKAPSGPPMPLAVARFPAQQLLNDKVITFKLDDSMAMSPALKLSSQSTVNIEARVSMAGTAAKQAGDFFVALPKVSLGTTNVRLQIQSIL